jgi:glutathionylspermidine synthase
VQSKRFPLTWDALKTPLSTWRALLPETCDPRSVPANQWDEWVFKPAFGRVGEDIIIPGVSSEKDRKNVHKQVKRYPDYWIAQRRFEPVPMLTPTGQGYPCIGVYTVNGHAAGIYGRLGTTKITDATARDIAVLLKSGV